MVSGDHCPSNITGPIYELRAVVTHQGQHENGHYICFRKHSLPSPETLESPTSDSTEDETKSLDDQKTLVDSLDSKYDKERWWRLSDERVWDVPEEDVIGQGGVFMLFYDCVDPNSVLRSSLESNQEDIQEVTVDKAPDMPQVSHALAVDEAFKSTESLQDTPIANDSSNSTPFSCPRETTAHISVRKEAVTMAEKATTEEPTHFILGPKEDNFVFSLLNRPNSTPELSHMIRRQSDPSKRPRLIPNSPEAPIEEEPPQGYARDAFVSSLLSRPNS
jgi:hypothetical protein